MSENSKRFEFCCDVWNSDIPLPEIFKSLASKNGNKSSDILVVALHVFMLELGFIPKDVPKEAINIQMPCYWQKSNDIYELSYVHPLCPDVSVNIKCLKVTTIFLAIYGGINEDYDTSNGQYNSHVRIEDYIIYKSDSENVLKYKKLSCCFKNEIGYPLLIETQEKSKIRPIWGFSSLPTDIKIHIMSFLDAPSLSRVACINTELNELAELPKFWKSLLQQDFPDVTQTNIENYKETYKENSKVKKRIKKQIQSCFMPDIIPHIYQPAIYPFIFPRHDQPLEELLRFRIAPEVKHAFPDLN